MKRAYVIGTGWFAALRPASAMAAANVTYHYDAKSCVVKFMRSGPASDGGRAHYAYDRADNRQRKADTGAENDLIASISAGGYKTPDASFSRELLPVSS